MAHAEKLRPAKHDKMKNVIIWYSHNTSAHYLSDEDLPNDQFGMVPNACSSVSLDEREKEADKRLEYATVRERFQTSDGIQYWHFKHKDPVYGKTWEEGEQRDDDIRYWIKKLDEKLQSEGKGETIDAIVVPIGMCLSEVPSHIDFINELKERYPDIKVIVHNPLVQTLRKNEKAGRFVWTDKEEDSIHDGVTDLVIKRQKDDTAIGDNGKLYHLQPGVDMITRNHFFSGQVQQNALRDMLGMEPLQQRSKQR